MAYEIVPYLVTLHPARVTDLRPINDLDGKKTTLKASVGRIYSALTGVKLTNPLDNTKSLRFVSLQAGANTLLAGVEPGSSGIRSRIEQDKTIFNRDLPDSEHIPLRQAFVFPSGSTYGWLFSERVAGIGSITISANMLKQNLRKMFPGMVPDVSPAMDQNVVRTAIKESPVKGLRFVRPAPKDASGRFAEIGGKKFNLEVSLRTLRGSKLKVSDLVSGDHIVPTKPEMLGYLVPLIQSDLKDSDKIKAQLLEDGWRPILRVQLNGKERSVSVGQERTRDLAFPITNPAGIILAGVPTDDEFKQSCADVLNVFAGSFGLPTDTSGTCQWGTEEFKLKDGDQWEVVWE